jgi:hypothetical protein
MNFCRICFFALAFCACTQAQAERARDASDVALDVANCAADVAEAHKGEDLKDPKTSLKLAADLEKCLPFPEPAPKPTKASK